MLKLLLSKFLFMLLILFLIIPVLADDGMWLPHQMKDLNLKELGLQMNPEDLYKEDGTGLMSAIVLLGGATGEFVSKEGLILTNHHVAFGAIQRASSPEHDYIQNGFLAENKEQEIPAQGYIADVLLGYEEITKKIRSKITSEMSYKEIYDTIDRTEKEIIVQTERQEEDLRCSIKSMYSGNKYFLFKFKRLQDVRVVYAPPKDLGNFGGDIDNWMWPRHTCDFTFLRAYVSKENKGDPYSKDNVPFKPKSIIKISLDGVKDGNFTFVMGYPGKTYRNYTHSQLLFEIDRMKKRIKLYEDAISFFDNASKGNKELEIKYARKLKGLNNGFKNYRGKIEGVAKVSLAQMKKEQENEFLAWVKQDADRNKKYSTVLENIEKFMVRYSDYYYRNLRLTNLVSKYYSSTLLSQAHLIYRIVEERQKPDMERDAKYQERNLARQKVNIKLAEKGYDSQTDKEYLKHLFYKLSELTEVLIPSALKDIAYKKSKEEIDNVVEQFYQSTILCNSQKRLELIELSPAELLKLNDPFISLTSELEKEIKVLRDKGDIIYQERDELKRVYLEAMLKQTAGNIASDANSSIRFTYGDVLGYSPKDAVYYTPVTTLKGVIDKDTGKTPFHVPAKLKTLYKNRDFSAYVDKQLNDIPVCFLNTTNVTGGNSGSPTLNAKGEQVGIIFDMTYESVIGDYYVIPEMQRTISVDIRYVLFITDKFGGAKYLLDEMGL